VPTPGGDEKLAPVTFLFAPRGDAKAQASTEPVTEPFAEPSGELVEAGAEKSSARASRKSPRSDGAFEPINNVSLHALGRRGVSAQEMNDLLLRRGFDADEVSAECARLLGAGLLDDSRLAEALVRTFRERKGLGRGAVAAELRRRKLDPLVIEQTLSEIDSDDDGERAVELALKRAPQLRNLDSATAQRRLSAFLLRKGYSGSAVSRAVSTALAGGSSRGAGPVFR
jgi:regulatory protein